MTSKNFIAPNSDLQASDPDVLHYTDLTKEELIDRWQTNEGQSIIKQWKESNYSRDKLDSLIGRYYGNTDLRGINLSKLKLTNLDFNHIDFFASNFSASDLSQANLYGSWLSGTNIKGTKFDWAKMDKVIIDDCQFDNSTHFYGVDLNKINFTLAVLLQDLAIDQQRISTLEKSNPKLALFLKWSCDYGRSISRFFIWTFLIILFYSLLYLIPGMTKVSGFIDSIYFSVITFTTLGYGDILPLSNWGKLAVISEVFAGFVMLGLLVAIISRKVIGR